jgi:predicted Zn-dependent peptidase
MIGESGVESANMENALTEIIRQLEEVKLGHFEYNELAAAKLSLANSFRTISDYLSAMESWSLLQTFDRKAYTPFEAADEVEKITRDEVIFAANRVTLDTVYTLTGNEEAEA